MADAKNKPGYNQQTALATWDYDPETGKLYWKKNGKEAGRFHRSSGYRTVSLKNEDHQVHRIIYHMLHGDVLAPNEMVDHIDRNKINNVPCNLQAIKNSQNGQNCFARKNRKFKGTYKKGDNWKCEVRKKGVQSKYGGMFDKIEKAAIAYDLISIVLYQSSQGANYPASLYDDVQERLDQIHQCLSLKIVVDNLGAYRKTFQALVEVIHKVSVSEQINPIEKAAA